MNAVWNCSGASADDGRAWNHRWRTSFMGTQDLQGEAAAEDNALHFSDDGVPKSHLRVGPGSQGASQIYGYGC